MGERTPSADAVRVAIDAGEPVGFRMARVLLGDPAVEYVGVLDPSVSATGRSGPIRELADYDVMVSDGTTDYHELVARCSVAGIPLVLWSDLPALAPGPAHAPVIKGANVAVGLTAALRAHPSASIDESDSVRVGWTEPGTPRRSKHTMPFPDPIGSSWSTERSSGRYVAFRADEWGGAVIEAVGNAGRRIVGVGDHAEYMEAITLAAVGLLASAGTYPPMIQDASAEPTRLLDEVTRLELDIAVWRSSSE